MAVMVAMIITATVTPAVMAAGVSDCGGSTVDVGVAEGSSQIGSLSVLIRTGQLESNTTTVKPIDTEGPVLAQSSI